MHRSRVLGLAALILTLASTAVACGLSGGTSTADQVTVGDGGAEDETDPEVEKDLAGLDISELIPSELPGLPSLDEAGTADQATPSVGSAPSTAAAAAAAGEGTAPGQGDIVGEGGSGDFCATVPGQAVMDALGGPPGDTTGAGDSCTWVRVSNQTAAVLSVSVVDGGPNLDLDLIVESTVEGIDSDGIAEAVDDVGDGAYLMAGDLGTYLYSRSGMELIVVYASDVPDDRDAVIGLTQAIIAS